SVPPPLNSKPRSIACRSTCTARSSKVLIAAGLLTTTEVSLSAAAEPAPARPVAWTLFSLSWKPEAWAWPMARAPATPRARADRDTKRDDCMRFFSEIQVGSQADRKSTRLNSSHVKISYAVFCLKKKHGEERARGGEPG